jgi:hypothetical protein
MAYKFWKYCRSHTSAKYVVCRKSGVGNIVKNHAHSLPSISKDLQTGMKLLKLSRIICVWPSNLKLHCCLLLGPGKWGCLIASFRVIWHKKGSEGVVVRWRHIIDWNKLHNWIQESIVALASIVEGSLIELEEPRSLLLLLLGHSSCDSLNHF